MPCPLPKHAYHRSVTPATPTRHRTQALQLCAACTLGCVKTLRAYDSGVRIRRGRCMHESVHRTGKLGTNLDEGCRGNALHGLREAAVLLVGETEAVGSRYRRCGAAMRSGCAEQTVTKRASTTREAVPQSPEPVALMHSIFESCLQRGEPIDDRPKPSQTQ